MSAALRNAIRETSEQIGARVTNKNGVFQKRDSFKVPDPITSAELMALEIPPIQWIVRDLLPPGVCMIGAPSKTGKSFMMIDLCLSVCTGSDFLGFQTNKSACLYCDLESTKRRPRDRIKKILNGEPAPDNFYILTGIDGVKRIGDGLEEQLQILLMENPEIRLIVIDVFQKIRPANKKNQTGYDRDYNDFTALKGIADKFNICILLVHHTRKMRDPTDVFNDLSGSVGIMGALDAAIVISKDTRNSKEATLCVTGRDMNETRLQISFDQKALKWRCLGTVEDVAHKRALEEYESSPIFCTIKKLVKMGSGKWEGSAEEIKQASKYFQTTIYDDSRIIGKKIREYEHFLFFDGIQYEFIRGGKERKYVFNVTSVTDDTSVTDVTNVIGV